VNWDYKFDARALKELKKLDQQAQRRILAYLDDRLKVLVARNGISAEEQHRRLLAEGVSRASEVREPLASYLVNHPVCPNMEIPNARA